MKKGYKFGLLALPLLAILLTSQALIIPEAQGITIYQSFSNQGDYSGWNSISDIHISGFGISPYYHSYPYCLSPSAGGYNQPIGYLRKTFINTNSTNFIWLNITAWYYVSQVISNQPNIVISLNDRLMIGDAYPSGGWMYQNNVFSAYVCRNSSVFNNFDPNLANQYLTGQQGFNILHYWQGWHKLCITLAQTNTTYTLDYYYDDYKVLTSVGWPRSFFDQPLECYDIKLWLGMNSYVDDVSIDYRYQTTPITTPFYSLWYLSYLFAPNDNPLIANKSYVLNIYAQYGGVGTPALLSLTIDGDGLGNFTTDNSGVYSLRISFPTPGVYDILIEAYDSGALVKTLASQFTVVTAPTTPISPISPIDWALGTLINILVPGIIVGIVAFGVSGLLARFDHGMAGFWIGSAMGMVVVANSGLIPMWFFSVCFIIGAVAVYYWVRE